MIDVIKGGIAVCEDCGYEFRRCICGKEERPPLNQDKSSLEDLTDYLVGGEQTDSLDSIMRDPEGFNEFSQMQKF